MTGRVTTVVMTRDGWPDLSRTLARHEPPVVVVDNGSSDGTPDLVRTHFPEVEVIALDRNHGAPARNLGVARARTPYVAFADDDSWWEPGALEHAATVLDAHPRIGVVAARLLVGADGAVDPVSERMWRSPLGVADGLPGPSVLGFLACAAVVRREAFLGVGGFDDVVFFMGEEERVALDLAAAGWALAYVPQVVAHHEPSQVRDRRGRVELARRNDLLTAVMRRPWRVVLSRSVAACRTPSGRSALVSSMPVVARALLRRKAVPERIERMVELTDGLGST